MPKLQEKTILEYVDSIEEFEDILDQADGNASSGWDMDFISSLRERLDKWGERLFVTSEQWRHLARIAGIDEHKAT
jgi:hypothetical protein